MVLFKRYNIEKILKGLKTQTRRVHVHTFRVGKIYPLRDNWFTPNNQAKGYILITRKFRQRLGDITLEDVQKEGYNSLEEFQAEWIRLYGSWDPNKIIWVYEFKLVSRFQNR